MKVGCWSVYESSELKVLFHFSFIDFISWFCFLNIMNIRWTLKQRCVLLLQKNIKVYIVWYLSGLKYWNSFNFISLFFLHHLNEMDVRLTLKKRFLYRKRTSLKHLLLSLTLNFIFYIFILITNNKKNRWMLNRSRCSKRWFILRIDLAREYIYILFKSVKSVVSTIIFCISFFLSK